MDNYQFGLIGLSVMGQNLALNIAKNYSLAVYNRTDSKTKDFIENKVTSEQIKATYQIKDFINSLQKPRKIMLMIKAGKPVDLVIDSLLPFLEKDDIIIDGGNSHFSDTEKRLENLADKGIRYLGVGISGGEAGALHGPSIMPGGNKSAYEEVAEILQSAAAKTEQGNCVGYLGPRSAGHYVKMVHNGIEYGIMEATAEIYDFLRKVLNFKPAEIGHLFADWNQDFSAYLLEITAKIMEKDDPETGEKLINIILDKAKQKGTGKWSVESALELGVAIPTINAGVNARLLSALKTERTANSQYFPQPDQPEVQAAKIIPQLKSLLYLTTIAAYAEGFKLLTAASQEYEYQLNYQEIARIWEAGCIIRSGLLEKIRSAYLNQPELTTLLTSSEFKQDLISAAKAAPQVFSLAAQAELPLPALQAAFNYFNSLKSAELPANLIQAQRDFFGAHTYQRKDKTGIFHTEWEK